MSPFYCKFYVCICIVGISRYLSQWSGLLLEILLYHDGYNI